MEPKLTENKPKHISQIRPTREVHLKKPTREVPTCYECSLQDFVCGSAKNTCKIRIHSVAVVKPHMTKFYRPTLFRNMAHIHGLLSHDVTPKSQSSDRSHTKPWRLFSTHFAKKAPILPESIHCPCLSQPSTFFLNG